MSLNNFCCTQANCTLALQYLSLPHSINTPFIFAVQEINGALFLNARGLFFLSLLFAPSIVISPLTTTYASL